MLPSPPSAPRPNRSTWGAGVLAGLVLGAAILLFAAIYLVLPAQHHYGALLTIGVLALVFAVTSYLAESFSRSPVVQRSLAWGFFAMGFAVLFLTVALGPSYGAIGPLAQLAALLVLVLVLIVAVALIYWRMRAVAATEERLKMREAWKAMPTPSALDYPAAHTASVPQVPPPVASETPPPRSP